MRSCFDDLDWLVVFMDPLFAAWLRSYLTGRTQRIILGDTRTSWVEVKFGVPQGSVLGPHLFILYIADITSLFTKHSVTGHLYADDVQAFGHAPPSEQLSFDPLMHCPLTSTSGCHPRT